MSLRSVPKIAFCRYFGTMTMWYRQYHRTWLWLCHSRMMWFLLLMALAGPWWEKPYLSSPINAGTAEPFRVSPPEAVAYPLELQTPQLSKKQLCDRTLFSTKRSNTLPNMVASSKESASKAWSVTKGERKDHLNRAARYTKAAGLTPEISIPFATPLLCV